MSERVLFGVWLLVAAAACCLPDRVPAPLAATDAAVSNVAPPRVAGELTLQPVLEAWFATDGTRPLSMRRDDATTDAAVPFFIVEGHADVRGPRRYNYYLSLARAQAVARLLIAAGVPAYTLQIDGKGETEPLCLELTPLCHARNRRVVVYTTQGGSRHP